MWDYLLFKIAFLTLAFSASGVIVMTFTKIFSKTLTKTQCYYLWLIPLLLAVMPIGGLVGEGGYSTAEYTAQGVGENFPLFIQSDGGTTKQITRNSADTDGAANMVKTENMVDIATIQGFDKGETTGQKSMSILGEPISKIPGNSETPKIDESTISIYTSVISLLGRANLSISQILFIWWACGVLLLAIYQAAEHNRFRQKMSALLTESGEDVKNIWEEEHYKGRAVLKGISADISPFVTGIFRPIIVVPHGAEAHRLRPILLHEITHLKRKDLLYLLCTQIVKTVHFFNPLAYVFSREIKKLMELSCDERVSKVLSFDEKRTYGITILSMMKNHGNTGANVLCLSETGENVKERLDVIMNKKAYTKVTRTASIILVLAVMLTSTVFAAVVNDQNPEKNSYVTNELNDEGRFYYRIGQTNEAEIDKPQTGEGKGTREIILINSPLEKSFSAKIEMPSYIHGDDKFDEEGNLVEEPVEKKNVTAEIRMNALEKTLDNGRSWVGKFTVTIDGKNVMDNASGAISNIPTNKKSDRYTELLIYDEKTKQSASLSGMNFNLTGSDMIDMDYERDQAERNLREDVNTKKTYVHKIEKAHMEGTDLKPLIPSWGDTIMYNPKESKADFYISVPRENAKQVSVRTNYRQTYECTEDSIKGKFFVYQDILIDEFYGTVTGLSGKEGDTVKLTSDDKRYEFEFEISDYEHSEDYMHMENKKRNKVPEDYAASSNPQKRQIYRRSVFTNTSDQENYQIKATMLPFTFTLNEDRTGVNVKLKEDAKYDGWSAIMTTYSGGDLGNLWEEMSSKKGVTEWQFPVLSDETSHLIQFEAYTKEPYIHMEQYEIYFRIIDNQFFYTSCGLHTLDNKDNSGDAGRDLLFETIFNLGRILKE